MGKTKDTSPKGKRKVLRIVLGTLGAIVLIGGIAISSIANTNVKAMNSTVDAALTALNASYTVTPVDVGDYKEMTISGLMKFDVEQYDIEGLGNLSVMRMNMGLMQMATFVITPQDKNMPLLSADYMYILSNRKAYLEFYDVVKEKDTAYNSLLNELALTIQGYDYLEDIEASEAWYADLLTVTSYKGGTANVDNDLETLLVDSLNVYLSHAKTLPVLTDVEKAEKLSISTTNESRWNRPEPLALAS